MTRESLCQPCIPDTAVQTSHACTNLTRLHKPHMAVRAPVLNRMFEQCVAPGLTPVRTERAVAPMTLPLGIMDGIEAMCLFRVSTKL